MTHSVDQSEIQHFSKDSQYWWDENGPFKPLHRLNPVRMSYIKAQICDHFSRDEMALNAFDGLSVLDIGCGGGLVCEPMARLGADITGVDADAQAIEVAREHARSSGLDILYENKAAEELDALYDVVMALEIIEHVNDPADFVASLARLVKPGGIVIVSTLNRTPKSFMLGIVGAEYITRWVPVGTHNWKKFVKPSELSRFGRAAGLAPHDLCGLSYSPLSNIFDLDKNDVAVNYFMTLK